MTNLYILIYWLRFVQRSRTPFGKRKLVPHKNLRAMLVKVSPFLESMTMIN
jgi:hypothetical protein